MCYHGTELSIEGIILHGERLLGGFLNLMGEVWKWVVMKPLLWAGDPQADYHHVLCSQRTGELP